MRGEGSYQAVVSNSGASANEGSIEGASKGLPSGPVGGIRSFIQKNFGEFSVFCKVRLELLRPILDLLDTVEHLGICFR